MMGNKSFVFRFGDVEVREREFSLTKASEALPVEPKAFRVLLILLRNPQKLNTKEELLNAVWGDAAVTENSLSRSIALLRRLLGDETHNPRFIETVATVGYRFVCPVEVSEDGGYGSEPVHVSAETADVAIQAKPRSLGRWWLVGAAVFAIALVFTVWTLRRPLPPPRISKFTLITHDGREKSPVGTDGSRVYFIERPPFTVAQVAISGGEIVPIPVAVPFLASLDDVSHDGSNFLVESSETELALSDPPTIPRALWSVTIPGGPLRRLGEVFGSAAFSPDGTSVAYSTRGGDIYLVRSDGTGARKLASVGGNAWNLAWSPEGAVIRFSSKSKIWEVSSSGSNLHEWLPGWHSSSWKCCGRWTPDGRFFMFLSAISNADLEEQIWALDERRGMIRHAPAEPVQLTTGPIDWSPPIPGNDGKTIFAAGTSGRGEVSRFDPKTKQFQPFLGGISAQYVAFSPDGQSVAYVTYPEWTLWKENRDGSNRVQLSTWPILPYMPRWSPDGSRILFSDVLATVPARSTAYIVSARGGAPSKLLPEDTGVQSDPDWSPDGHKIVFGSSLYGQDPKSVIRIFDLDSKQITNVPGSVGRTNPRWSPDGRFIAANSFDLLTMNIFDCGTQRWSALSPKLRMSYPEWSKDSRSIYFLHGPSDPGVYRMRIKGGELEKIVDLKNWPVLGWGWMGLDPTGAPLLVRDISSNDIYALTLEQK
jgi:Tol biopolymer transport system component/DNA-binding winged helix-turn-helix (wHTH) protein